MAVAKVSFSLKTELRNAKEGYPHWNVAAKLAILNMRDDGGLLTQ